MKDKANTREAFFQQLQDLNLQSDLNYSTSSSLSFKYQSLDVFGDLQEFLCFGHTGAIQPKQFLDYRLDSLSKCLEQFKCDEPSLKQALRQSCVTGTPQNVSLEILLHACIDLPVVFITQPLSLLAALATDSNSKLAASLDQENVLLVEFTESLVKTTQKLKDLNLDLLKGIFIKHVGLVTFGTDLLNTHARMGEILSALTCSIPQVNLLSTPISTDYKSINIESLPLIRKQVSRAAGKPLLLRTLVLNLSKAEMEKIECGLQKGSLSYHYQQTFAQQPFPASEVPQFCADKSIITHASNLLSLSAPSAANLIQVEQVLLQTLSALKELPGKTEFSFLPYLEAISQEDQYDMECNKQNMFTGEIALVTGAASGIGKACVQSLLERGAVVIGLDIDEKIKSTFAHPAFYGIVCDLTSEDAVRDAFTQTALAFGGLDMLVLNAGIFPSSSNIESLDLKLFQKVMRINLDANLTIMQEAYKLLKNAPMRGRVLINSSRNVPAPGPGAAAYSVSKAGLTQLGRVAALEWGKDGICVNMINPHAVFDTGIWTDEVLKSRAEKYGMTVDQYKKNNVLHVELTSRDIGELVAEMLGPVFAKTTGAQVPVDGGCDRVI